MDSPKLTPSRRAGLALACAAAGCFFAPSGSPPDPPELRLAFAEIKRFDFDWDPAPGADYYFLYESPESDDRYEPLGGKIVGDTVSYTMPLHRRFDASYILRACNAGGCTDSAALPVTDPLIPAIGYFKASKSAPAAAYGTAIAVSSDGTTLAVGAPFDGAGTFYVYALTDDEWREQARVEGVFGPSVALADDGDTLLVGAPYRADNAGAAHVFTRSGDRWSEQAVLTGSNTAPGHMFGVAVALAGDGETLAVGAPFENGISAGIDGDQTLDPTEASSGATYVFTRAGGSWSQQAYIKASYADTDYLFGAALALSRAGDVLAVGSPGEASSAKGTDVDGPGQLDTTAPGAGAAYVFERPNHTWSQTQYLKASNTDREDRFGAAVALSDDGMTLAVGAPAEDSGADGINGDQTGGAVESGAVYLFFHEPDRWRQKAYVKAGDSGTSDLFGTSLALTDDGGALVVGAPGEGGRGAGLRGDPADDALPDAGAAYLYLKTDELWAQRAYIKAANPGAGDQFGWAVALSGPGDTLVVSAPDEDSNTKTIGGNQTNDEAPGAGAVYLY